VSAELRLGQESAVFQLVYDDLLQRIRAGEWPPGTRLPSIARLARSLRVSTGSVREALRSLQSMGLVRIEHGRGVFVTGARPAGELAGHFATSQTGLLVALAEARRILEPELAALAAERASDVELAEIDGLARAMEEQARLGLDFVEPDLSFHYRIAEAARNPVLLRMLESIHDLLIESRSVTEREPGMTPRAVRYHLLIAEALCERDAAQARLLMLAHMNHALSGVLSAESRRAADQAARSAGAGVSG
jgi:GntR family transcriptional repressor for pyruvate dehydrogenase complex